MNATLSHVSAVPRPEVDHIRGLDGLRGIAVLLVVAFHLFAANSNTPSRVINIIYAIIHSGWIGVDLFFVLSGFLITRILFTTQHDHGYYRNFYAGRFLRIFPLYYAVLIVLLALNSLLHLQLWPDVLYYFAYVANLRPSGPLQPPHLIRGWILLHFWSLQVEEQFYLVWPFVLLTLRTKGRIVIGVVVGCIAAFLIRVAFTLNGAHLSEPTWAYAFTPCRVDTLLVGSGLGILWFSRARSILVRAAPATLAITIAILAVDGYIHYGLLNHGDPFMSTFGFALLAIASAALIVLVLSRNIFRKIFEGTVLCWLGKYSYGIYVLHFPLDYLFTPPLRAHFYSLTHIKGISVILAAACVGTLSVVTAYASYELMEKRFLRFKSYFSYKKPVAFEQPAF